MVEALCVHLSEYLGLYLSEMAIFLVHFYKRDIVQDLRSQSEYDCNRGQY